MLGLKLDLVDQVGERDMVKGVDCVVWALPVWEITNVKVCSGDRILMCSASCMYGGVDTQRAWWQRACK